ncbi:hypothetical protein B0H19DRAFT_1274392 [Mycena capillaripes]|nr:hypothetical protein B0H19DRAFT_1274392 [Mycena capillaripes]
MLSPPIVSARLPSSTDPRGQAGRAPNALTRILLRFTLSITARRFSRGVSSPRFAPASALPPLFTPSALNGGESTIHHPSDSATWIQRWRRMRTRLCMMETKTGDAKEEIESGDGSRNALAALVPLTLLDDEHSRASLYRVGFPARLDLLQHRALFTLGTPSSPSFVVILPAPAEETMHRKGVL